MAFAFEYRADVDDVENDPRIIGVVDDMLLGRKFSVDIEPKTDPLLKLGGYLKLRTDAVLRVGQIVGLRDQSRFGQDQIGDRRRGHAGVNRERQDERQIYGDRTSPQKAAHKLLNHTLDCEQSQCQDRRKIPLFFRLLTYFSGLFTPKRNRVTKRVTP